MRPGSWQSCRVTGATLGALNGTPQERSELIREEVLGLMGSAQHVHGEPGLAQVDWTRKRPLRKQNKVTKALEQEASGLVGFGLLCFAYLCHLAAERILDAHQIQVVYDRLEANPDQLVDKICLLQLAVTSPADLKQLSRISEHEDGTYDLLARQLAYHICTGRLPKSLPRDLQHKRMATFPQTAKCQDDTFIFNLQRHMWLYLCAQCPISEICLMPAVHPGKAQLDVIRAGAGKLEEATWPDDGRPTMVVHFYEIQWIKFLGAGMGRAKVPWVQEPLDCVIRMFCYNFGALLEQLFLQIILQSWKLKEQNHWKYDEAWDEALENGLDTPCFSLTSAFVDDLNHIGQGLLRMAEQAMSTGIHHLLAAAVAVMQLWAESRLPDRASELNMPGLTDHTRLVFSRYMALLEASGLLAPDDISFALHQLDTKWPQFGDVCDLAWLTIIRPSLRGVCDQVSRIFYAMEGARLSRLEVYKKHEQIHGMSTTIMTCMLHNAVCDINDAGHYQMDHREMVMWRPNMYVLQDPAYSSFRYAD